MDLNEMSAEINEYFSQLNDEEKYAWLAEIFGFILVVVGIVLIFW
jgi:hypothetical protein